MRIENVIFSHSYVIICRAKRLLLVVIDYVSQPVGGHVCGLKSLRFKVWGCSLTTTFFLNHIET